MSKLRNGGQLACVTSLAGLKTTGGTMHVGLIVRKADHHARHGLPVCFALHMKVAKQSVVLGSTMWHARWGPNACQGAAEEKRA